MSEIKKTLEDFKNDSLSVAVFYESPKRIVKFLTIVSGMFPDGDLCICNDLTKKYERIYRGNAYSVLNEINRNEDREKGEYTVVLRVIKKDKKAAGGDMSAEAMLTDIIINKNCTLKEAVALLASEQKHMTKRSIYAASLNLKTKLQSVF